MTGGNGQGAVDLRADDLPIVLEVRSGSEAFTWVVSDPEQLAVVRRYRSVRVGVEMVWTAGVCALRAASGGLEAALVREQLAAVSERLLRAAGSVEAVAGALVAGDGPLARLLAEAGERLGRVVEKALRRQADAEEPGSVAGQMAAVRRAVGEALVAMRQELAAELGRVVAGHTQLVGEAVRSVRDLDEGSALGRALVGLGREVAEVKERLAVVRAREEALRGSAKKGEDFEVAVVRRLAVLAAAAGDTIEHTGRRQGGSLRNVRASNAGDVVVTTPRGTAVVFECMDRRRQELGAAALRRELGLALANRPGAVCAVAVLSTAQSPVLCGWPLAQLGPNMFVVGLDGDALLPLQVAYRLARELALAAAGGGGGLDPVVVQGVANQIAVKLRRLQEACELQGTIGACQRRSVEILVEVEQDVRELIERLLGVLKAPDAKGG